MTWIERLVTVHQELESPKSFWFWSGLAALSAVVKDNVWLDRAGAYNLYPNIYVMLHADSALKKGAPVRLAKKLVKIVNNNRIISGRSSIQGIMKELGTAYTIPGGTVINKSTAFIIASEFSSSLVADPAALSILTDLYDRIFHEGEWKSLLKMETFSLKDPTITLLVATNEAHFDDFLESRDIHGGFMGRTFVIAETKVNRLNPLIKPLEIKIDIEELAEHLKEVSKLKGQFTPLDGTPAGDFYERWYYSFYQSIIEQDIKDETGTIGRLGDSVLKVAMLLALSEKAELTISENSIKLAIDVCEKLIPSIRKVSLGKRGKSPLSQVKAMIIRDFLHRESHQISRIVLMKKFCIHVNVEELNDIMESFHEAGMITIGQIGNQIIYTMPESIAQEMIESLRNRQSGGKNESTKNDQ